ncbi:MAG: polymorphic toxin type 50 domain-containing protein [Hyphomicrobiaceae bacterium]
MFARRCAALKERGGSRRAGERITRPGGAIETKHYIGDVAVVTMAGTATATRYLHKDHLGSVDTITDEAGTVVQRMSFDAWGKRRETNWLPMTGPAIAAFDVAITTRGFTGHEMVDGVGLVHMNGRIYDPEIGRFLSADPFVQELANLQSWNRYSYVLNNPLSYTDPSGFFFAKLFKSIGAAFSGLFNAIGSAFKALLKSPIFRAIVQIVACFNPVSCVLASGAMALATGGSIMDALNAMVISFAQIGISSAISGTMAFLQKAYDFAGTLVKSAVHGAISGAIAVAQGGNFLQGFASGAIGVLGGALGTDVFGTGDAGMAGRTAFAAAAGCLGALVTGGKCAQAAVTAAIAHLYNAEGAALARPAISLTTRLLPYAATAALLDGPILPIGDAVGVLILGGALIYDAISAPLDQVNNVGIDEDKKGKHVPGHKNFIPGRSKLTDDDPQSLLDKASGKGQQIGTTAVPQPGSKERYDWDKPIGNYVDGQSGNSSPTTVGIIHYGKRGAHIVPARPKP